MVFQAEEAHSEDPAVRACGDGLGTAGRPAWLEWRTGDIREGTASMGHGGRLLLCERTGDLGGSEQRAAAT